MNTFNNLLSKFIITNQSRKYDINEIYRKLTTTKPRLTVFYVINSYLIDCNLPRIDDFTVIKK